MLELHASTTLLVDLAFTLHWDGGRRRRGFGRTAFAASVATETAEQFLRSLDQSCLARARAATRGTRYRFEAPVNYEVERAFVWAGLDGPCPCQCQCQCHQQQQKQQLTLQQQQQQQCATPLSIRSLSAAELESQLRLLRQRGYRDWVRVEMAVEIEAGPELQENKWSGEKPLADSTDTYW